MLSYEDDAFYTSDDLLAICENHLNRKDKEHLLSAYRYFDVVRGSDGLSGNLFHFARWEMCVRRTLARMRAQKLGWEFDEEQPEVDADAERVARDAISQESPLEAEMILQRARWEKLDGLSVGHYFDIDWLVVYMLKLLVLERNGKMTKEEGAERFNDFYSRMVETLQNNDGVSK